MRNNQTTFSHPETIRKIKGALWVARIEAAKLAKRNGKGFGHGKQYVENRKGNAYLRVDVVRENGSTSARIWGDCSRDVTGLVLIGAFKKD